MPPEAVFRPRVTAVALDDATIIWTLDVLAGHVDFVAVEDPKGLISRHSEHMVARNGSTCGGRPVVHFALFPCTHAGEDHRLAASHVPSRPTTVGLDITGDGKAQWKALRFGFDHGVDILVHPDRLLELVLGGGRRYALPGSGGGGVPPAGTDAVGDPLGRRIVPPWGSAEH